MPNAAKSNSMFLNVNDLGLWRENKVYTFPGQILQLISKITVRHKKIRIKGEKLINPRWR